VAILNMKLFRLDAESMKEMLSLQLTSSTALYTFHPHLQMLSRQEMDFKSKRGANDNLVPELVMKP
jgi:hypothetical protein